MTKNSVIFKGVQNGLLILLDDEIPFIDLKKTLSDKVKNASTFFEGANVSISFKGRELSENEEMALLKIITKESGLEISFINDIATINNIKENECEFQDDDTQIKPNDILQFQNHILTVKNNITHFHRGSLRNGQEINFEGSVVIIGNVNPGAKIYAEGNVVVLGKLKGNVHAGCMGDKNCFVSALKLMPTQIIIGDCIIDFSTQNDREVVPEYVYIKDGQPFVESLLN